jgi:cytidyltransferase-like protein
LHAGHVRLFNQAKKLGDKLVVIVNNDNWLMAKKSFVFMQDKERKEVIKGLRAVDKVIISGHPKNPKDMSIVKELKRLKPNIFANGGDRTKTDANKKSSSLNPEQILCKELGIKMVFNVGRGGKIQSSSWLLNKHVKRSKLK